MAVVLISALVCRVLMDICFKFAVQGVTFGPLSDWAGSLKKVVFRVPFIVAFIISVINFWLWMHVLAHYDLSFAYPLFSVCFVLVMLSGTLFFNETLDQYKVFGMLFILASTVILVFG
jgi:multidrug transporter EmrE-like cation transporter